MAPTKYSPLVESLLRPAAYPGKVASVELVETHISYLFLTGQHVYKVKKSASGGAISDGRWEIYQQQRREWEPIREVPEQRHLLLDTNESLLENLRELLYRSYCNVM